MSSRLAFYLFVATLTVLDAVLLRSPNLVGKIGLFIYKYHYLRTFPKTLLTLSMVIAVSSIIAEAIRFMVKREIIKRLLGQIILSLTILCAVLLVKTGMDFSGGAYSHTGLRFRAGAYLLPAIMVVVFAYGSATVPRIQVPLPESPIVNDKDQQNDHRPSKDPG